MRKIATFSRQILLISCLTSCSEETQTVDWYVEHLKFWQGNLESAR